MIVFPPRGRAFALAFVLALALAPGFAADGPVLGSAVVSEPVSLPVADMPPSVGWSVAVPGVSLVGGVVLVGVLVSPVVSPEVALSVPPWVTVVSPSSPQATRTAALSPRQRNREMF